MKARRFVVPSLLAAGFSFDHAEAAVKPTHTTDVKSDSPYIDLFRLEHKYDLARHRSHSSHRSHRSHRSSSGGSPAPSYTPPSRNERSTPPESVLPRSPSTAPQRTLPGNSAAFAEIVRRIQAALFAQGYYTGAIDGTVGPETRAALSKFQKDHGLEITGTITPETLDALRVVAK